MAVSSGILPVVLLVHIIAEGGAQIFTFNRGSESNVIMLTCRDSSLDPLPDFWVNDTSVTLQSIVDPDSYRELEPGMVEFTLTPDIEGLYYCGDISAGNSSDPREFVGKFLLPFYLLYSMVAFSKW